MRPRDHIPTLSKICDVMPAPHHGVYDALGVHHNVDVIVVRAEQVVSLNDLEALVHHRSTVDSYLGSHVPVWML